MEEENRLLTPHTVPTWNNTTIRNPSSTSASSSSISSLCLVEPPPPNIKSCISSSKNSNGGNGGEEEGKEEEEEEVTGRERLKRHREEVKGNVKIPESWGQEKLLTDWIDYTTFDALLAPRHRLIVAARDALVADGRSKASSSTSRSSQRLRIHI